MSDAAFLVVTMAGLTLLDRWTVQPRLTLLVAAAVLAAVATLTRYTGIAVVVTGVIVALAARTRMTHRLRQAAIFGVAGLVPLFAWLVRNSRTGTATDRQLGVHIVTPSQLKVGLVSATGWVAPVGSSLAIRCVLVAGWLVGLAWLVRRAWAVPETEAASAKCTLPVAFVVVVPVYSVFVLASISLFDATTPLDDRILAPVFVALVIDAACLAPRLGARLGSRAALWVTAGGLVAMLVLANLYGTVTWLRHGYRNELVYGTRSWARSPTVAAVRKLAPVPIFTNRTDTTYLLTGRGAEPVPEHFDPFTSRVNRSFAADVVRVRQQLRSGAVVVWYDTGNTSLFGSERDVVEELALTPLVRTSDGTIYGPRHGATGAP
jgi:hypothetical protein